MSTDHSDAQDLVAFLDAFGANSSEVIKGIYSTPWTAIPFTVAVLGVAEVKFPGVTNKFWAAIAQFFAMIGSTLGNALAQFGTGTTKTIGDFLKNQGASPTSQPPPPPPPPPNTHQFFAHTSGYTAFMLNQVTAAFSTAGARDKWVSDTNGSIESHLLGNYVNETWDQDVDAKGNPVGSKQNDARLPPPKPWWIIPA